ncbi:MAG: sugar phosphate nucleotidyltransferase [Thermodesulfobacteriota bacterium]|nr:sugar phosphate nucleotidyltransferase [Thermodesulfobacteriota bacterium]
MKALILAAGLGTRLLPYTLVKPKPMFTLNNKPILQITIEKLIHAGFTNIIVNTHHLPKQIEDFIKKSNFPVLVETRHEHGILETGGAIKNVQKFMGNSPFLVINSDIVFNIDLKDLWNYHLHGSWPATLVMHDFKEFNKVEVNRELFIEKFHNNNNLIPLKKNRLLAFTGVQVLSPEIFDFMPDKEKFSSIDIYKNNLHEHDNVKAYIAEKIYWSDIGTCETYKKASVLYCSAPCFDKNFDQNQSAAPDNSNLNGEIKITKLAGDGSDRSWFRALYKNHSVIIADHGIDACTLPKKAKTNEIDSFINIGNHLFVKKIPVPEIKNYDLFSGMVVLEDLGDTHLHQVIKKLDSSRKIFDWYRKVSDHAINFSIKGAEEFDPAWTYQTSTYSKELILEKECQYFISAFIQGYLKQNQKFNDLKTEFEFIADNALKHSFTGLMHRDMQSRNIMVKNHEIFFIDFQSARKGPLQYDLASLLIDPYVDLSDEIKEELLKYTAQKVETLTGFDRALFIKSYRYCAVTRNMQILGAFSHLSQNRGKTFFKQYIPGAVKELKKGVKFLNSQKTEKFNNIINQL